MQYSARQLHIIPFRKQKVSATREREKKETKIPKNRNAKSKLQSYTYDLQRMKQIKEYELKKQNGEAGNLDFMVHLFKGFE
mgnify:CR=1 FL=1